MICSLIVLALALTLQRVEFLKQMPTEGSGCGVSELDRHPTHTTYPRQVGRKLLAKTQDAMRKGLGLPRLCIPEHPWRSAQGSSSMLVSNLSSTVSRQPRGTHLPPPPFIPFTPSSLCHPLLSFCFFFYPSSS